jgi:hypothetical protein
MVDLEQYINIYERRESISYSAVWLLLTQVLSRRRVQQKRHY